MANIIGANGLSVNTRAELIAYFTQAFQTIYGSDITLTSDSPDGQMMGIFVQSILDTQDLLVQIYNNFDPDTATGNILDQRVAINGIQRQAGTYTITNITVVTSQALTLYGQDQTANAVFTIQDNAGNKFQIQSTQNIATAGTYVFPFIAVDPGAVLTTPNTITIPVTIVLGVVSVNNPTTYTTLGINEETDAQLRVRRQASVSMASQGFYKSLRSALLNITGVTQCLIYENTTNATDVNNVPGHSIWVIVGGTGASSSIANAIYQKRNAGCGMYGTQVYNVTQVDGTLFPVYWDNVTAQNFFVNFTASSIDGINLPNISAIKTALSTTWAPTVYQEIDINHMATIAQNADPNCLVTNAGLSNGQSQTLTLSGIPASGAFVLSYNSNVTASINWNDSTATIQTKVQAVSGMGSVIVTGSLATQTLTFTFLNSTSVQGLIFVTTNTLATSAPANITFSYNENYQTTLTPSIRPYQFVPSSANIVITPMILSPYNSISGAPIVVAKTTTKTFTALGGYSTMTYSISVNNSGGTINASTGLYTAGSTANVNDTIKVTDALGNTATAIVAVV